VCAKPFLKAKHRLHYLTN